MALTLRPSRTRYGCPTTRPSSWSVATQPGRPRRSAFLDPNTRSPRSQSTDGARPGRTTHRSTTTRTRQRGGPPTRRGLRALTPAQPLHGGTRSSGRDRRAPALLPAQQLPQCVSAPQSLLRSRRVAGASSPPTCRPSGGCTWPLPERTLEPWPTDCGWPAEGGRAVWEPAGSTAIVSVFMLAVTLWGRRRRRVANEESRPRRSGRHRALRGGSGHRGEWGGGEGGDSDGGWGGDGRDGGDGDGG